MKKKLACALALALTFSLTLPAVAFASVDSANTASWNSTVFALQKHPTLKKNQTAYGLFKYIRDSSPKGSPAYVDAQCGMDVLTGKVSKNVEYPQGESPKQTGTKSIRGHSCKKAYKSVNLKSSFDAAALNNVKTSLEMLTVTNMYRKKEKAPAAGTNCRMLAIAIVQSDWTMKHAKKYGSEHSLAFSEADNLASGGISIGAALWYGERQWNGGHYTYLCDKGPWTRTYAAGYGYSLSRDLEYRTLQSYSAHRSPCSIVYSIGDFKKKWFNSYYADNAYGTNKKANTLRASAKKATVTLREDALATGAETIANLTVKKAKGKVTYANASSDKVAKTFKVSSKGKVSVPKGTQAGTYELAIQVKAAGNATYKTKHRAVSFTVVVKPAAQQPENNAADTDLTAATFTQ